MKLLPLLLFVFAVLFVGCGKKKNYNAHLIGPDNLNQIIEGATDIKDFEYVESSYATLAYLNGKPFTGWAKKMRFRGESLPPREVLAVFSFKEGRYHGTTIAWHKNGQKMLENKNEDGDLQWEIWYYENGQKKVKQIYNDNGESKMEWYDNGVKKSEVHYKKNKNLPESYIDQHIRENLNPDHIPLSEHGLYAEWHKNGQPKYQAHYNYGIKHGMETTWDEDGNVISQTKWENGEEFE